MTLIIADRAVGTMLSDDGVASEDLMYRSFAKVTPWGGGYLGLAGYAGRCASVIANVDSCSSVEELCDLFEAVVEDKDGSVDGLLLLPDGLWLLDSMGSLLELETDYAAIGSGACAAMAILTYTNGSAILYDVAETVALVVPSVSPRFKLYELEE